MQDTDLHLGTPFAPQPIPRVFNTHSNDTIAGNDHLRRGGRKESAISPNNAMAAARSQSLTISYLEYHNPAPCLLTVYVSFHHIKPIWTCFCPAGEPVQGLTASKTGSKFFPGCQGPSKSSLDLPFHLYPSLQLFRRLNSNLHIFVMAFLSAFEHTDFSVPGYSPLPSTTCQNHIRPHSFTKGLCSP